MIDERWSSDIEKIGRGLRAVLDGKCRIEHVRAAEAADGRDHELESALEDFGLWEIPDEPEMYARAAYELGRALAPIPFVETYPAQLVFGRRGVAYGFEGDVPASAALVARRSPDGVSIDELVGPPRRTSAGDLLIRPAGAVDSANLIGSAAEADLMWRAVRLLDAARTVGASEALLTHGVAYVKERVQFGKPIGAFQGVAHKIVDARVALDGADLLVRKAAWVADQSNGGDGAPSTVFAIMARAKANEAGRIVASTVHQAMGGIGFTMDEDTQLYTRRIRSWTMRLGRVEDDLVHLASVVLDPDLRVHIRHLWHNDQGLHVPSWATEVDHHAASAV